MSKNTFNTTTNPRKNGTYTVQYTRAKSKEVQTGIANYTRGVGFDSIRGPRGSVHATYDRSRNRYYEPTILGWR